MNKFQKKVCKALYKENCYILVSATKRDMDETYGEYRVKTNSWRYCCRMGTPTWANSSLAKSK